MQYIIYYKYILFFCLVLVFTSCENKIEEINRVTSVYSSLPALSNKNIELVYTDSGNPVIKLKAPLLNRFDNENPIVEMPKGVNVLFYEDNGSVKSSINAKYGVIYESKNIIEVRNNVVVINSKGEKLETEYLIWEQDKQVISSNVFVKVSTGGEVIYGDGFVADQEFEKWEVIKPKGIIAIKNQ
ncbi:MAG: LPS export ABC transporter periplasmic protein LptC [Bacteroidetes bacterium GWE2_29_8]|nr:MAG: LPS export ABC transporter periplasmic protein LptC [Bacteroidetes bacterium GWE2_29_8]OFY14607.1 MAG: LPS export ABC transporter periplasmic protein LptC [Bacteroidetes bacterium GWF2_29_10]